MFYFDKEYSKQNLEAMAKQNVCKNCRNKNCEFKGKRVKGHVCFTTENCLLLERNDVLNIVNTKEYKALKEIINNQESDSKTLDIFKKAIESFETLATGELI